MTSICIARVGVPEQGWAHETARRARRPPVRWAQPPLFEITLAPVSTRLTRGAAAGLRTRLNLFRINALDVLAQLLHPLFTGPATLTLETR